MNQDRTFTMSCKYYFAASTILIVTVENAMDFQYYVSFDICDLLCDLIWQDLLF